MAAKCFSQLFRKLKTSVYRSHYRKVVKAMSNSVRGLVISKKEVEATWELFPADCVVNADLGPPSRGQGIKVVDNNTNILSLVVSQARFIHAFCTYSTA